MYPILEHPEITRVLRTGYPTQIRESDLEEFDEDALYEERRESEYDWE